MPRQKITILTGVTLDDQHQLSFDELCRMCHVQADRIFAMVEQGLIEPFGASPNEWHFSANDFRRTRTALRLQKDLEINLAGIAIILDLLDEMRIMEHKIKILDK